MLNSPQRVILMADDDEDDRRLLRDALKEINPEYVLMEVNDGVELIDYLQVLLKKQPCRWPDFILLDFKMPRKDGREALREIKQNPFLRKIPIIAWTTSTSQEDISASYELGANVFIPKPVTYTGLIETLRIICRHWLEMARLPP